MKKIEVFSYNTEYEFNKALKTVRQNGYTILTDTFNTTFNGYSVIYSILVEKEMVNKDEN